MDAVEAIVLEANGTFAVLQEEAADGRSTVRGLGGAPSY